MVARLAVLVALCLAACADGDGSVHLTLSFDSTVSDQALARVTSLAFVASGDETGEFDLAIGRAVRRTERLVYRPHVDSREFSLAIAALDGDGASVARGDSGPIAVGPELVQSADVTLNGDAPPDGAALDGFDAGADAAPLDLADPSLVAYYKFDEGAGVTAGDASTYGNHGTLTGGPTWVPGVSGSALAFTAGSSVVVPNATSLSGMAAITVATWIKISTTGVTQDFVSKRHDGAPYYSYDFSISMDGKAAFEGSTTTTGAAAGGSTSLAPNVWYHVAGTYDGVRFRVYVNGVAEGFTNDATGNIAVTDQALELGFEAFSGSLDELRIYARALTPDEIQGLFLHP